MTMPSVTSVPLSHPDSFFIDGQWVKPSSDALFEVVDSETEESYFHVPEAKAPDAERAIAAARHAFDEGPWPRLTHAQRADFLRALAAGMRERTGDVGEIWPRQSGVIQSAAIAMATKATGLFDTYADLAATFPFTEQVPPSAGGFGLIVREPVGVVCAIVPWNSPIALLALKVAPALLAGCTVIVKASPEAPGEAYILAEVAEVVGLPAGVINVLTADREVSEMFVRDPRVNKIAFTGSTVAGRRIASLMGERIGRYTLELGGKSAAVVLDDADIEQTAAHLAGAECLLTGQVCAALTRIIVPRSRHDDLVGALVSSFQKVKIGSPFDPDVQMGPMAMSRARETYEGMVARGVAEGTQLALGGGRPKHLERGYFVEPAVFSNVDNESTIARDEIFGPVLAVIPVDSEEEAVRVANDTIYGLNASVFTADVDRAFAIAGRLQSGTVGLNAFRVDYGIAFGGFKQSGVGREGGREGLLPYLEVKTIIGAEAPTGFTLD